MRFFSSCALAASLAACGSFGSDHAAPASSDAGRAGARPGGPIVCNTETAAPCASGSQACCLLFEQVYDRCIPRPGAFGLNTRCPDVVDAGETRIVACDDSSECASGEVCCGDLSSGPERLSATCLPSARCDQPGYSEMCNRRGLDCGKGKVCRALAAPVQLYSRCE